MRARHILVIRLSALGDVAMLYPIIFNALRENENLQITLVTRPLMAAIFEDLPRLDIVCPDLHGKHRGFLGLHRLYKDLSCREITAVVDAHNVLRSIILSMFFRQQGCSVYTLEKHRKIRKQLVRKKNKVRKQLQPVVERYQELFIRSGVSVSSTLAPPIFPRSSTPHGIGIAPFAGFTQKELPWQTLTSTIEHLSALGKSIYLFAAPGEQRKRLQTFTHLPAVSVVSFAGGLRNELAFMAGLEVMLSMDSANCHLASLVGCPVITVWGATHRHAGFVSQSAIDHIEVSTVSLPCRPCSSFGNVPCYRGDLACLHRIEVREIVNALNNI